MAENAISLLLVVDNASDARLLREALADGATPESKLVLVERLGEALERPGEEGFGPRLDPGGGQVLKIIAERTAQAVGAGRCSITLRRGGCVVPVMSQFADGRTDPNLWAKFKAIGPRRMERVPAYAEAIRTKRPVMIEDMATSSLSPAYSPEAFGARSALVVPLVHQDEVIGTLALDQTKGPYAWSQE